MHGFIKLLGQPGCVEQTHIYLFVPVPEIRPLQIELKSFTVFADIAIRSREIKCVSRDHKRIFLNGQGLFERREIPLLGPAVVVTPPVDTATHRQR
ncbi:hypothetical protein AKJ13_06715 [Methylobacterium sp. ARG-1]|nr:hypothetical protein AKJ13_06715 [Methylobacterium sp. ARG-1]